MSGVGPFYINIHNVTFGKRWTVPKIDPLLWTAGKVLVTREEEFAVELVDIDSPPIGGATEVIKRRFTITAQNLVDKSVGLPTLARPDTMNITVHGGIPLLENVDFYVDGANIKWDGLSLELRLEVGSILMVDYMRGS